MLKYNKKRFSFTHLFITFVIQTSVCEFFFNLKIFKNVHKG